MSSERCQCSRKRQATGVSRHEMVSKSARTNKNIITLSLVSDTYSAMFPATVQLLDEAILHALVDESVDVFCDSIDEARSAFQNNIISEGVLAIFMTFPFFWATLDSPGVKLTCFDPVTYAEPETWFVDFYVRNRPPALCLINYLLVSQNEAIKNLKIKPDLLRDGGVQVWYDDDKQLELFDVRKNLQHRQDLVKRTWEYGRNRMIAKAAAVARKGIFLSYCPGLQPALTYTKKPNDAYDHHHTPTIQRTARGNYSPSSKIPQTLCSSELLTLRTSRHIIMERRTKQRIGKVLLEEGILNWQTSKREQTCWRKLSRRAKCCTEKMPIA